MLDQQTVDELVAAAANNEGLRQAIEARSLPLKPTMKYLREQHRSAFKAAHAQKVEHRRTIDEKMQERGLMARFYDAARDLQVFHGAGETIELPMTVYVRTFGIPESRYGQFANAEDVRRANGK